MEDLDAGEASRVSADTEILAQPANTGSDCATPVPGSALPRFVGGLAAARPEGNQARAVADISLPHALPSIDDAVDQLTADLAAFCFDELERRLTWGDDEDHEMGHTNEFEGELRVRLTSQRIYKSLTFKFDPLRSRRLRHMLPMRTRMQIETRRSPHFHRMGPKLRPHADCWHRKIQRSMGPETSPISSNLVSRT